MARLAALAAACSLLLVASAQLHGLQPYAENCLTTNHLCFVTGTKNGSQGCGLCEADPDAVAPLLYFEASDELLRYLKSGSVEPITVVMPDETFIAPGLVDALKSSKNVVSMYIERDANADDLSLPARVRGFSPASKSPNAAFGLNSSAAFPWNPDGLDLLSHTFHFPVYSIDHTTANYLRQNNSRLQRLHASSPTALSGALSQYPRVEVRSKGIMWACGQTAGQCLSEGTCQPIGGHSAWVAAGDLDKDLIGISAAVDSTSFVPEDSLGSWEISGMVVLMTVADSFMRYRKTTSLEQQRTPVFLAFTAETFGYAGSDRFFYDVENFSCDQAANVRKLGFPGCVKPYHPTLRFLALRNADWHSSITLGPLGRGSNRFVHSTGKQDVTAVQEPLIAAFGGTITAQNNPEVGLPPSSAVSFVRWLPDVPSVFLSTYYQNFDFGFYESSYDSKQSPEYIIEASENICDAAEGVVRALVNLTHGEMDVSSSSVNRTLVNSILGCFTRADLGTCTLAKDFLPSTLYNGMVSNFAAGNVSESYPSSFYTLPQTQSVVPARTFRQSLLRYFIGYLAASEVTEIACSSDSDCVGYSLKVNANVSDMTQWKEVICAKHVCVVSDSHFHQAFGTAITPADPNLNTFTVKSDSHGAAFTESVWDSDAGFCVSTVDSYAFSAGVLVCGIAVWLVSGALIIIAVNLLRRRGKGDISAPEETLLGDVSSQ